ncbi:unnamed protein product [Didymodactylos carnosus]|uniref:Uncharacterized protein n=1 Tax=Didymodactylos carnosus TaxID=1234261 RepID=A0A8S2GCX2_9BILA|nr:unnamed protein product [Didymodactylos carnosus]CAF3492027.1 unnamed protein product [Didymodactylos carnosus]
MGNASLKIKDITKFLTKTNREHGVGHAINTLILHRGKNFCDEIEIIAIDLDGTLLLPDLTIAPSTILAIQKAHQTGCRIVIATGRNVADAIRYFDFLGLPHQTYMVTNNGAIIYDLSKRDFIYSKTMSQSLIVSLFDFINEQAIVLKHQAATISISYLDGTNALIGSPVSSDSLEDMPRSRIAFENCGQHIPGGPIVKFLVYTPNTTPTIEVN